MPASDEVSKTAYQIIKYGTIGAIALGFMVLILFSFLVRDTAFITQYPMRFLSELFVISFLTSLPVLYIGWMRRGRNLNDFYGFLVLFLKIALMHVGFQLSGVYTIILPRYN